MHTNAIIDDTTVRFSLPEAGLSPSHMKCMWSRLLNEFEEPRLAADRTLSGPRSASEYHAAIDMQMLPRYECGGLAAQESDHACYILHIHDSGNWLHGCN